MRAVNLLPCETTAKKFVLDRPTIVGVAFTAVVVLALFGGFFLERAHAGTERQQQAAAQSALAQAQSRQTSTNSPPRRQLSSPVVLSQQEPWHVALDAALATRVSWDVLLRELEFVVPDRVTLTNVTVGGVGATPGSSSGAITLGGSAYSAQDIALFLSTLERVPKLSQVTLVSSAIDNGSKVDTFQITAQMTVPAPPAAPTADTTTTTGGQG